MMRAARTFAVLMLASACNPQAAGNNDNAPANAAASADVTTADDCAKPEILLADSGTRLRPDIVAKTKANFAAAYGQSCVKGILESAELYDADAVDPGRLFLFNAPEANVASIYMSKANDNRMVLEFPFLTADGEAHVPTAEALEEAIYCKVVGATPQEEEKDGRCLVD